ncbi:MAG: DUF1127 domain-containing protein [Variovorax sp.]|nr:MAG: DUF1127 domain-containing protein [Variovorax sp.]
MHTTTIPLRPSLALQAKRALHDAAAWLRDRLERQRQARQARVTAQALGRLDDRVLRDLGLDRSELLSAAVELHGLARRDRRPTLFGPSLPR